jgi:hypothetical protein
MPQLRLNGGRIEKQDSPWGLFPLGMAGIHRSSTLPSRWRRVVSDLLGMAGIHRSSTLAVEISLHRAALGMAGIHRSSTLRGLGWRL